MTWNASFTNNKVEAKANKTLQNMPAAIKPKDKNEFTAQALDAYCEMLIKDKVVRSWSTLGHYKKYLLFLSTEATKNELFIQFI